MMERMYREKSSTSYGILMRSEDHGISTELSAHIPCFTIRIPGFSKILNMINAIVL